MQIEIPFCKDGKVSAQITPKEWLEDGQRAQFAQIFHKKGKMSAQNTPFILLPYKIFVHIAPEDFPLYKYLAQFAP